ncbi:MAG: glycosyltransferase family 4 protein [Anaerolineae bacterium]|nr:glycosyltransferase family 4 protein [Anaerolineae bacterium]
MYRQTKINKRLKVFTWHVHGAYLYYLTQANCDFYIPYDPYRSSGYGGKVGADPFGPNLHEIPVDQVKQHNFDVILFQSRQHYEQDQYDIFSQTQLRLPKVYLEHDPPREHPTDTKHVVTDLNTVLVHCTNFNRLMWDSNGVPTTVIDHGVVEPKARYTGKLNKGIVVINNLQSRGRRLGLDVFEYIRQQVPIDLIGMGSKEIGGLGEIPHNEIPAFVSQYRFFFNPIRYTSLGLAIIEAMMVGLPIVGLATTELVSVITSGVNGYVALDPDELVGKMKALLASPGSARVLGDNARNYALKRFSINRFAREWEALFYAVCEGRLPNRTAERKPSSIAAEGRV